MFRFRWTATLKAHSFSPKRVIVYDVATRAASRGPIRALEEPLFALNKWIRSFADLNDGELLKTH